MRPLAALLLLASLVPAGDDRPDRKVPVKKLQLEINRAIDKGVTYLKRVQNKDGSWTYRRPGMGKVNVPAFEHASGGLTALALYAIAASGVPSSDAAVKRAVRWTERNRDPFKRGATHGTYSASLLVLALTRIDPEKHERRIQVLANRLVGAQLKDDMWTYGLSGGRGGRLRPGQGDNSNSQFAVLALWAAMSMANAKIPRETWERILRFYERTQLDGGGWLYVPNQNPEAPLFRSGKPSMTAAGLVSYVYATAALLGGASALPQARRSMVAVKGLDAFMIPATWNMKNYYFVYALERVGTVLAVPEDKWYYSGARALVAAQSKDGRWQPAAGPARGHGDFKQVYETALAVLFLSRATYGTITPGGGARTGPVVTTRRETFPDCADPKNLERAFGHYQAYKPADRARVAPEFAKAGTRAVEYAVRRLRDPAPAARAAAFDLLGRLVEKRFLFDPKGPAEVRAVMLAPIEDWWRVHGDSLRWDPGEKRFRARS